MVQPYELLRNDKPGAHRIILADLTDSSNC